MTDSIKIHAEGTGKASIDALGASITAIDAKLNKLAGSALKAGEASKFLEAEVRKVQKAETGRATAVTGLTKNIDALQAEITKLGRVGGATDLKRQFDSLKKEFNAFDNLGFKSIDKINQLRAKLDQALGGVGAVLGKKRGLTQGQFDSLLDVANAIDASGKKVLAKVTTESEAIEKAILASGKRQAAAVRVAAAEKAKAEVQAAEATANLLAQKGRYTPYNANAMKPVYGTKMSLDETRKLLGMPDRNEMKTFAAQLKSQMSEELATTKLKAGAATKMSLDETRKLLGMPDRKAVSDASAELRKWMLEEAAKNQAVIRQTSRQQLTTPANGVIPLGSFSSIRGPNEGTLNVPRVPKSVPGDLLHLEKMKLRLDDLHSAARGVASGFGAMWLTWGNLMPLLAGAALSNSIVQVVKLGASVQNTTEIMRVLGEESVQSISKLNAQLLELARNGPFGPLEIAEAMKTLTLAGLSAAEVGASIKDVLNFAVAGDTSIAKSADVLTSVAKAFGLTADSFGYVGNVIAKTAAVSKSSVDSIGEAFKTASVINKQYGVSLVDVGTGLAALSNLGIQGTAAGVALRNMYVDLGGRTAGTKKLLKEFNLELRDSNGNFKDIITVAGDVNRVLDSLQDNISKKDFLQKALSERGAKPLIELLDLARRNAKETGESVGTELDKLRTRIQDSAGFVIVAAAQMALTPLNQMKSVVSTLQATMVEAFNGLEPIILSVSGQLKDMFNSPEFKTGLQNLIAGIASLTLWLLDHAKAIGIVIEAYLGFKAIAFVAAMLGGVERAILSVGVAATGAGVASSAAAAGVARFSGALGLVTRFLGPVTAVLTVAWGAWELYGMFTGKAKDKLAELAGSSYSDQLIAKLKEETRRLEENTEAKRRNLSVEKYREEQSAKELTTKAAEQTQLQILTAQERLVKANRDVEQYKTTTPNYDIAGTREHAKVLQLMSKANSAKAQLDDAKKGAAEVERRVAEAKADVIKADKVLEAYTLRDKAKEDEALRGKTGSLKLGDPGGDKRAAIAATKEESASLKEAFGMHKVALEEIKTLKAKAEAETAQALAAERRALLEINTLYAEGAQIRIDATSAIQLAMAGAEGSVMTRAEGEARIAAIQLEGNRAELAQIVSTRQATQARYAEEVRVLGVLKEQTLTKLRGALAVLRAEQAKIEPMKDNDFHKENYAKITAAVAQLDEQIITTTEDTKALNAAQQAYTDAGAKGMTDFNKKLDEQNNALKALQVTAQKELKLVQDTWKNRAKSANELEAEQVVQQRLLATNLMEDARRKAAAGDIMAAQAKILADTAALKAETLELKIATAAAMSTDWYAAVEKALKDYAAGLRNVAGEIANVFTKAFKGLEDVLTDFITKGKADFKGFVKSILADLARIAVRQNIIGPMVSGFAGGMAGGGGAVGALGSVAGTALGGSGGGLLSGLGNTVGGWFGAGGAASAVGGSALGAGGAASGAAELAGTVATNTAAGGGSLMSGLSAAVKAIPVWGWGLMAAAAIAAIAGKGETRSGGQYGYSTDGATVANARRGTTQSASGVGATFLEGPSGGTGDVSAVSLMNNAFKGINDLFKSVGSSETVTGFQSGYESSKNSRGGVFAGGTLASGKTFGESGKGDNYAGTLYEKTSAQTVSIEEAAKNYVTDLKQATVQAMQAATDLPKLIADKLKDLNAETMDDSALDALMGDIQNIIVTVNSFRDTLDTLPFAELRDMSFDAAAGLVQAVGGLDKLGTFTTNLSSYFENFYSEAEKRQNTVKNITGTLNKAGLAVTEDQVNTATKETFRQVVEQYAAMGTEGQDVYLALLSVNQAFSDLSTATGSFLDDLKSYTESFSTKKELRASAVTSITEKLNKNTSGVKVTESMVSAAGIKDFRAAVEATKAMGPAGRSAYESLLSVNQEFLALGNDQLKLDELLDTYGDLEAAADELNPPADKLVDSWRKNKSAIQDLNDALDEALGIIKETTAAEKAVAAVKTAVTNRDDLKEARKGINDTIDSIRLAAASPADKVTLLKGKEAGLREEFATSPTAALFDKLTQTTLERIRAEGALRQTEQAKLDKAHADTLESQLTGLQRLKDMAGELAQFVSDLKIGDLSALSPKDQLAEAKRLYEDTLAKAKGGDVNAINNLQGNAQQYLQEAQTYWGGATSPYAGIFGSVTSDLSTVSAAGASGTVDSQITLLTTELDLLREKMSGAVADTSKEEIAALEALGVLADDALEQMDKNIVTLTEAAEKQILLLQSIVDAQEVELTVQIAKHKELINVLDRIDDNTGESSTAAKLENAKA